MSRQPPNKNLRAPAQQSNKPGQRSNAQQRSPAAAKDTSPQMQPTVSQVKIEKPKTSEEKKRMNDTAMQLMSKLDKQLSQEITTCLEWNCPDTSAQDWDNVPEISATISIYLKKHLEQVVIYLNKADKLETTASLRDFCTSEFCKAADSLTSLETESKTGISNCLGKFAGVESDIKEIKEARKARITSLREQPYTAIVDFYEPGCNIQDSEYLDPLQQPVDDLSTQDSHLLQTVNEHEARMFSVEQLQLFWFLFYNRSTVSRTVTKVCDDRTVLQEKVAALEAWRTDLEARFAAHQSKVEAEQTEQNSQHRKHRDFCQKQFDQANYQFQVNDKRDKHNKETFQFQAETNTQFQTYIDELAEKQEQAGEDFNSLLSEKVAAIYQRSATVEDNLHQNLDRAQRDIERLRIDVVDQIETKYDQMKAQFRVETADLKKRYEDSINLVQDASNNLSTLFQHKMVKIKDKISRFFGETDIHLNRINTEMLQTSKLIKQIQEAGHGPQLKYDTQLFALRELVTQAERDREASQNQIKQVVKQLVVSLIKEQNIEVLNRSPSNLSQDSKPSPSVMEIVKLGGQPADQKAAARTHQNFPTKFRKTSVPVGDEAKQRQWVQATQSQFNDVDAQTITMSKLPMLRKHLAEQDIIVEAEHEDITPKAKGKKSNDFQKQLSSILNTLGEDYNILALPPTIQDLAPKLGNTTSGRTNFQTSQYGATAGFKDSATVEGTKSTFFKQTKHRHQVPDQSSASLQQPEASHLQLISDHNKTQAVVLPKLMMLSPTGADHSTKKDQLRRNYLIQNTVQTAQTIQMPVSKHSKDAGTLKSSLALLQQSSEHQLNADLSQQQEQVEAAIEKYKVANDLHQLKQQSVKTPQGKSPTARGPNSQTPLNYREALHNSSQVSLLQDFELSIAEGEKQLHDRLKQKNDSLRMRKGAQSQAITKK